MKNGARKAKNRSKGSKTNSKVSNDSTIDPHNNYKPARLFPSGLIRKTKKVFPGIEKYPFNIQQDFKFFFNMKGKLSERCYGQMMKLFRLYRFCIISSHEFLEMIAPVIKKISLQEFSEYRNIILTREQTRRSEIGMFKPLQKMKFQSTFFKNLINNP